MYINHNLKTEKEKSRLNLLSTPKSSNNEDVYIVCVFCKDRPLSQLWLWVVSIQESSHPTVSGHKLNINQTCGEPFVNDNVGKPPSAAVLPVEMRPPQTHKERF